MTSDKTLFQDWQVRESTWKVSDMPARLRPDATVDRLGFDNTSDASLVACIVDGNAEHNAVDVSDGILAAVPLNEIANLSVEELSFCPGLTARQARRLLAAIELGKRVAWAPATERPTIRTPEAVSDMLNAVAKCSTQESFYVIPVDTRNRAICDPVVITKGTLDASLVHPREVFSVAIRKHAAAIIVAHNHPSGDTTPSAEDIRITKQLVKAGQVVDIRILDHVIVTGEKGTFISMREQGLVDFS